MPKYHVRVVGGSCGATMYAVAEHLSDLFDASGYECRVTTQSIWETSAVPTLVDLILQLLPAFSPSDTDCPIINIKPLLLDLNHPPTIRQIFEVLEQRYPALASQAAVAASATETRA